MPVDLVLLEARVRRIEDTIEWFHFKGIRRAWGMVSLMLWVAQRLSEHFNNTSEVIRWLQHYFL